MLAVAKVNFTDSDMNTQYLLHLYRINHDFTKYLIPFIELMRNCLKFGCVLNKLNVNAKLPTLVLFTLSGP